MLLRSKMILNLCIGLTKAACGCTEIGIVTLAAAQAAKFLPNKVEKIHLDISQFIYRNDVRVGVPKIGKCGIPMMVACGFVMKNPKAKLAVLADITKEKIEEAQHLCAKNIVSFSVPLDVIPVYAKITATDTKGNVVEVLIKEKHDNIVSTKLNGVEVKDAWKNNECANVCLNTIRKENINSYISDDPLSIYMISIDEIYTAIKNFNEKDLNFLAEGVTMNQKIVDYGAKKNHHSHFSLVFKKIMQQKIKDKKSVTWQDKVIYDLSCAIDARMFGSPLPVMSSCSSGDHGLTVFVPNIVYARNHKKISKLTLLQALALANAITYLIKKQIGTLSAYCGTAVAAATGSICGIAFQKGFTSNQINNLINYMLCYSGNIICDGAKLSCSCKATSAIQNGFLALDLVANDGKIDDKDGIVSKDCRQTIYNIGEISRSIMNQTNAAIVSSIDRIQNDKKW